MIELYLFINPLDEFCLTLEKELLQIGSHDPCRIRFNFIPVVTLQLIQNHLSRCGLPTKDLALRNELSQAIFSATLDHKTVQLQGQKLGRQFLIRLQEEVSLRHRPYCPELVKSILSELPVDMQMFDKDRHSDLIMESFNLDQQVAQEMGVEHYATAVIFNDSNSDFGIRVDSNIKDELIKQVLNHTLTCSDSSVITIDSRLWRRM